MRKGIQYKGVIAMPGSDLHKALSDGNAKVAENLFKDIETRYRKLMGIDSKPSKENNDTQR